MMTITDWIEIGTIHDIPRQGARVVETGTGPIAVFRTMDDYIFALNNRCPHKQGPLSEGIVHGHQVSCPLHNWVIDLESGEAQAPDKGCAHQHPLRREGDRLFLGIEAAKRCSNA
jgi:nitrite reductase (NADH) small subunit